MLFSFLKAKVRSGVDKISNSNASDLTQINNILKFFDGESLYPEFRIISLGVNKPVCEIDGKKYLQFCSNNYLSITEDKSVASAAIESIEKYGVGPGGSRVVNGNIDVIVELEKRIASLVGAEDCLTFPTGYMANVGIFRALMDPMFNNMPFPSEEGVIFSDENNHGSIVDGCRLSKAKKVVFRHNDLVDLRKKISENNQPNKLIVTEGVFSTDGEIINIPAYIELAKETNSLLMVDDAHGIGILGERGGGIADLYNCGNKIDVLMGSMDKAFGGTGGYLCGTKTMIKYLRIAMRSSLLSSAIPTVTAASMIKAIDLIESASEKRKKLFIMAEYTRDSLKKSKFTILGESILPAIPLLIGDETKALNFSRELYEKGIFTSVFRWPAVPSGKARLRITIMADHAKKDVDTLITACNEVGKRLGVI